MSQLERIIWHWTAGTTRANSTDREHYHFLFEGDGTLVEGKFKPDDNLNTTDGTYAKHTAKLNTGSIGIAVCGMSGFNLKDRKTAYPLTRAQMENAFKFAAGLCIKYSIPVSQNFTHYEIGLKMPDTENRGKIDITYLPYLDELPKEAVGDYIRNKVQWYFERY